MQALILDIGVVTVMHFKHTLIEIIYTMLRHL